MGVYYNLYDKLPQSFPDANFTVIDLIDGLPSEYPNLRTVIFAEEEAGYLAGVIAGLMTNSQIVAEIISTATLPYKRYSNGFKQGVLAVCPRCNVIRKFNLNSSINASINFVKDLANKYSFDILFGVGGDGSRAAIVWASQNNIKVIGSETDESGTTLNFPNRETNLGSVGKRLDFASTKSIKQGSTAFKSGIEIWDLDLGGIQLTSCIPETCPLYSAKTIRSRKNSMSDCTTTDFVTKQTFLNDITNSIRSHTINIGVDFATGDLMELKKQKKNEFQLSTPFGIRPSELKSFTFTKGTEEFYLFGGINNNGVVVGDLYKFKYLTYDWDKVVYKDDENKPQARYNHGAFLLGMNSNFEESDMLLSINIKKLNARSSITVKVVETEGLQPPALSDPFFSVLNSTLILYATSKWEIIIPTGVNPQGRAKGKMLTIDYRVLIIGGFNATGSLQSTVLYDSIKNRWDYENTNKLPTPLDSFGAFVYRQKKTSCLFVDIFSLCPYEDLPQIMIYGGSNNNILSNELLIYRLENSIENILICKRGFYSTIDAFNRPICTECPSGMYNTLGDNICRPCPEYGADKVYAALNSWQDSFSYKNSTPQIFPCKTGTCCQKSDGCDVNSMCTGSGVTQTTGPLCSECVDSRYAMWSDNCIYCENPNTSIYLFVIFLVGFLLILILVFVPYVASCYNGWFTSNCIFVYQVMGLTSHLPASEFINTLSNICSLDFETILKVISGHTSNDHRICLGRYNGVERAAITLIMVTVFLLQFFFIYSTAHFWIKTKENGNKFVLKLNRYIPKYINNLRIIDYRLAAIQIGMFLYIPLSSSATQLLSCQAIIYNGKEMSVLSKFPDQYAQCWSSKHIPYVVLATIVLFFLVIIVPGILIYKFMVVKAHLKTESMFTSLSQSYEDDCSYGSIVEYFERIAFSFVLLSEEEYKCWSILMILLLILYLQKFKAYKEWKENFTKFIFLICMIGTAALEINFNRVCVNKKCNSFYSDFFTKWQITFFFFPTFIIALRFVLKVNEILGLHKKIYFYFIYRKTKKISVLDEKIVNSDYTMENLPAKIKDNEGLELKQTINTNLGEAEMLNCDIEDIVFCSVNSLIHKEW
ncbi:hypothetical protein HK099_003136 [Clydaea vesicula]|uniref:ABC transporter substrate-binding protein PnrA-like domain-containing protein n=1 Tax=Clydaea vesicula TaxID=447962 RepID=A0AAD5UB11_9FUNG|nr:hypothetical protein HK099_003136 [Clydaea vesicula]